MQHGILPLFIRAQHLFLATDDPSQQNLFKEIQFHTGFPIQLVVVETDKLYKLINKVISKKHHLHLVNLLNQSESTPLEPINNLSCKETDDETIIKFVNQILLTAIKNQASDIHFEPNEDTYCIRYRQDGVLIKAATPPFSLYTRINARIKILANLDIAEYRMPQDGHFQLKHSSTRNIDFRVSTCPTIHGEKLVLRIIDKTAVPLDIDFLGLNELQKKLFLAHLHKPQGLILVSGPTGSGKTVSLYTALALLNSGEKNIASVEDPVEIKLAGINQVNVNTKIGLSFSTILRAFLRQDPDIIMIGEIRDHETAELAIRATQTGHLVLSTLHANNAAETINRLLNIGISPFNIANSTILFMAQRLIRRLCEHCKKIRNDLTLQHLQVLGYYKNEPLNLYQARGCQHCIDGYCGRLGIFELMPISEKLKHYIMAGATSWDIQKFSQAEGMKTLYQAGLEKVKQGLTSLEEINRLIAKG